GGAVGREGREFGRQAVGQEGGGPDQGLQRQVPGQGLAHGDGGQAALQPGDDARREVFGVGGGEQQSGVFAAQAGEDVGGRPEEVGGRVAGLRYGGESTAAWGFLLRGGGCAAGRRGGLLVRSGRGVASAGLVAGDGGGGDGAGRGALAGARQVGVGLQFARGGGDPGRALGEAGGEGLDVDGGAGGEGLDVARQSDRQQGEVRVLGEVVADHREAGGVAGVVVG